MDRETALALINASAEPLKRLGIDHAYLFGSTVRGESGPSSDVDVFFDIGTTKFTLFDLLDAQDELSSRLGCKADVMARGSLHPILRSEIESEAVQVF